MVDKGNSGIEWIDNLYDWCILLLIEVSAIIGITYEEINVYLFVFIIPFAILISMLFNIYFYLKFVR